MPVLNILTATLGAIAAHQLTQKPRVSASGVTDVAIGSANAFLPASHVAMATAAVAGPQVTAMAAVESVFTPVLPDRVFAKPHVATVSTSRLISTSQHPKYRVSTSQYPAHRTATVRAGDMSRKTARRQAVATSPAYRTNGKPSLAKSLLAVMDEADKEFLVSLYRAHEQLNDDSSVNKNGMPTNERELVAFFRNASSWVQNEQLVAKMQATAPLDQPASEKYAMLTRRVVEAMIDDSLGNPSARASDAVKKAEAGVQDHTGMDLWKLGVLPEHGSPFHTLLHRRAVEGYVKAMIRSEARFYADAMLGVAEKSGSKFDEQIQHAAHHNEVHRLSREVKNVLWRDAWQLSGQHKGEDIINGPNKLLAHHFATRFNLTLKEADYLVDNMGTLTRTGPAPCVPPKATGPPVKDIDLKENMCEHFPNDPQCKH